MRPLCIALICSLSTLFAQQPVDSSAAHGSAVDQAYAALKAAETKFETDSKPLMQKARDKSTDDAARTAAMKELTAMRQGMDAPRKAFEQAFAAADWSALKGDARKELLKQGLLGCTRSDDHALAVKACNAFLASFADDKAATSVRGSALPNALLGSGDAAGASTALEAAIADASGGAKARMLLTLGDIAAAGGDLTLAKKHYDAAADVGDTNSAKYVELRRELIGKPAPEIDSKTWIGGEAKPLSALRGKVVLVDFWATWCGPCRMVMPALSAMYTEHKAKGLEVLGLTHFYKNGYMPATKAEMTSGGQNVSNLDEATFPAHVEQFRKVTEIAYPFVIGSDDHFKAYHVSGIPTLAVVDRTGKIAMVTVGAGSEALLQYAVKRLLADD